jgi:hypothetical protein
MVKGEGRVEWEVSAGRYARLKWLVSDLPISASPIWDSLIGDSPIWDSLIGDSSIWDSLIWDSLIFAKEFLGVFHEADDDDDGGAGHANKEHDLQDVHGE